MLALLPGHTPKPPNDVLVSVKGGHFSGSRTGPSGGAAALRTYREGMCAFAGSPSLNTARNISHLVF